MRKTFLYKAKINKQTEQNANHWLGLCRNLYNAALEQRIMRYRQHGKSVSFYDQVYQLPPLKNEFPEFKTVGSQVLEDVLKRLDGAFKAFFRRIKTKDRAGFPRFKGKNRYESFTLRQCGWRLSGRYLHVNNLGRFKLFLSRPIEGDIKTITVQRKASGKWLVSFSCDNVPVRDLPMATGDIGLDVGLESFLTDSQGNKVENPKYFRQSEKFLKRRQRRLGRRVKGSVRRMGARTLVAKAYEKVSNQRKDFLHKTANRYIKTFKNIYVEDLNIKGMVRNHYLAKSINDCAWGKFIEILCGKVEDTDRTVIKVPPQNTSQICSSCGIKVHKSLAVRIHHCPSCGLKIHRDHNAALNINRLGQSRRASTYPNRESVA